MVIDATKKGLSAARANGKLIATLWLINAAVAAIAVIPLWVALASAMESLPLADPLGRAISPGVLYDLAELQPGVLRGFGSAAVASFAIGIFVGLGFAGGALEVLSSGGRGYAARFGRGAFRFYGRFLRLGIATAVLAAVTAGIVAGPLLKLRGWVRRESASEWLSLGVFAAALAGGALMVLLALLAQDAARVTIVRDDARGVVRALRHGMALVWGHPASWLAAWGVNTILLLAAFALYLALAKALAGIAVLAVALLLHQLFVAVRCALRVALLGTELALVPVAPSTAAPEEALSELRSGERPALAIEMDRELEDALK